MIGSDGAAVAPYLLRGDRVRVIAPSGPVVAAGIAPGMKVLEQLGLQVSLAEHALTRRSMSTVSDDEQVSDLRAAFGDADLRAVIAARGGYGVQRLIDRIAEGVLASSTAVFLGFSDLTALHLRLFREHGRVSLYGPTLSSWARMSEGDAKLSADSLAQALMSPGRSWSISRDELEPTAPLSAGVPVTGTMLGGNLAMLASSVGTPDQLRPPAGGILLLEDVREPPYRVDRMMWQLARSGCFDQLAGLALGQFVDCTGPPTAPSVLDVLRDWTERLGMPTLGGLSIGHGARQDTVALGCAARIDPAAGVLICNPS